MIKFDSIRLSTLGKNEIIDITRQLKEIVAASQINSGNVLVFVPGATGGISTIEYEPGLLKDFPSLMESLIPEGKNYSHDLTWHDGNGHSHLRATLVGPSLTIPFIDRELTLGTWQQVVFLEFDNKPHDRKLMVQVMGE